MAGRKRETIIRGARTHNLRNVSCRIPLGRLTAVTGVSGSGKSTLAFDTLYAEGQRRFVECLSAYARQFLERLDRPDVDFIGHIEPPIALRQKSLVRNARSTVGTLTEINDDLRLLFAHAGETICPDCGRPVSEVRTETVIEDLARRPAGERVVLAAPVEARHMTPEIRGSLRAKGYVRVLTADGIADLADLPGETTAAPALLVMDRLVTGRLPRSRLRESVEEGWRLGSGRIVLVTHSQDGLRESRAEFRLGLSCPSCGKRFERLTPAHFSSNSPLGACAACQGFGRIVMTDPDKVVPDRSKSLREHAVALFATPAGAGFHRRLLKEAAAAGVATGVPWSKLPEAGKSWVWKGSGGYKGVEGFIRRLERKSYRMHVRVFLARFRGYVPCGRCKGARLRSGALDARLGGRTFHDLQTRPISDVIPFFDNLDLPAAARSKVEQPLRDVRNRLESMRRMGLEYLELGRPARTLSGGETQRIRLAAALGAGLTDTLYVLDEPTVGLHAVDAARMLRALRLLTRQGNTVVVVEHDPAVIRGADHLIVLGPGGGGDGGRILYEGGVAAFRRRDPDFFHPLPASNGSNHGAPRALLRMTGLRAHNLRIPRLDLPADRLTVLTGLSGSGKSTLLDHVLHRSYLRFRGRPVEDVGEADSIEGFEGLDDLLLVPQIPLGRSSRSCPLTFIGAYPEIRKLLGDSPAARARGLKPGAFSFNTPGGRCEACAGLGTTVLEMHFLPDVDVLCEACRGMRFRREILEVTWKGKSILDVLTMTVDEAEAFFARETRVVLRLRPLQTVGLGYIRLGQPTSTLSGGEAQRLKLASFLSGGRRGRGTLFLLDEPTTGLHPRDVARLIHAIRGLIDRGHGVFVVEHQLDLIEAADWVVDLGPGGGDRGGRVVYEGPVEGLVSCPGSVTGRALSRHRKERSRVRRTGGP